jgi:hypothetical protein
MARSRLIIPGMLTLAALVSSPACTSASWASELAQTPPVPADAIPAQAGDARPVSGLPPQDLRPGECGAFFWDRAEPNPLVLFENESRGLARLWQDGGTVEFSVTPREFRYYPGLRLERRYALPSGEPVVLSAEITELRDGEAIVGRALLRRTLAGGAQQVSPLMGLISCRETDDR